MAKKISKDAAAVAATAAAPKSTQKEPAFLPCALRYFFTYATLGWSNCRTQLPRFFAEADRFTEDFIATEESKIKEVKELPRNDARLSAATTANLQLQADAQVIRGFYKRLRTIIEYVYKNAAVAEAELK